MLDTATDPATLIAQMGNRARRAATQIARIPANRKCKALMAAAAAIRASAGAILAANAEDMAQGQANGLSPAMLDRLALNPERIEAMAAGIEAVAVLRDPVGMVIDDAIRPNGLKLSRVRVPLGVVGII